MKLGLERLSGARRGQLDALASFPATIGSAPGTNVLVPGAPPALRLQALLGDR